MAQQKAKAPPAAPAASKSKKTRAMPVVQVGRVICVTRGPFESKIAVIVDVIDHNRALVDGPASGVKRQAMAFRDFRLTPFVINIAHGVRSSAIKKVWDEQDISNKFSSTKLAINLEAKKRRAAMTDFDRFKLYKTKQRVNRSVKAACGKIRKKVVKPRKPQTPADPAKRLARKKKRQAKKDSKKKASA